MKIDYKSKFSKIVSQTHFNQLALNEQNSVTILAEENRFSQQELKRFIESLIDLQMWNEGSLVEIWQGWRDSSDVVGREFKKTAFQKLDELLKELQASETEYQEVPTIKHNYRSIKSKTVEGAPEDKILGMCPVQSEKTLCCNLRTLDAVKNCGFGCTYCSIQTMYNDSNIFFDSTFKDKVNSIELDPNRDYHIGTGQSSDALMWGNKEGILDCLFDFARNWPRVILEFKTKSKNINYFLENDVPRNIVCTWSLNPEIIIKNEEPLTASLEKRIAAARAVADKGVRVGFHFHPMVYYKGWEKDYAEVIKKVTEMFSSDEVVFISFGTLTFPKPIIKKIRNYGIQSKIHQMPMVPNPEGKMTYPDEVKRRLFKFAYQSFSKWHEKVFFYLCMEASHFWEECLDNRPPTNEEFERRLIASAKSKLI